MQITFIQGVLESLKEIPVTATAATTCFMETFTDWNNLERFMAFLIFELPNQLRPQTLSLLSATTILYLLRELDSLLLDELTRPEWEAIFALKAANPTKYGQVMKELRESLCPKLIDTFKLHIPSLLADIDGFLDTARILIPFMRCE
jgi:hypothetical protein